MEKKINVFVSAEAIIRLDFTGNKTNFTENVV